MSGFVSKGIQGYTDRTCIIIVDISNMPIGLIVDAVSEVITIPGEDVSIRLKRTQISITGI